VYLSMHAAHFLVLPLASSQLVCKPEDDVLNSAA
jgi:hypothetical protein